MSLGGDTSKAAAERALQAVLEGIKKVSKKIRLYSLSDLVLFR